MSTTLLPGDQIIATMSRARGSVVECDGDQVTVRWTSTNRQQKVSAASLTRVTQRPLCGGSGWTMVAAKT